MNERVDARKSDLNHACKLTFVKKDYDVGRNSPLCMSIL